MTGKCINCTHYKPKRNGEEPPKWTNCKMIMEQDEGATKNRVRYDSDHTLRGTYVMVDPEFGCVHFEPSETVMEKIKNLCLDGLTTDGGHHKQYYLEEILKITGLFDVDTHRDYMWDGGIPG